MTIRAMEADIRHSLERLRTVVVGKEAIYREKPLVAHVRIAGVAVRQSTVAFHLESLPSPGFLQLPKKFFKVDTSVEHGSFSTDQISSSPYVGWQIFLMPELIAYMLKHASALPDVVLQASFYRESVKRYLNLSAAIEEYFRASRRR